MYTLRNILFDTSGSIDIILGNYDSSYPTDWITDWLCANQSELTSCDWTKEWTHEQTNKESRGVILRLGPNNMSNNGHFNDEYDLKEELGKGAFSIVRRCVKVICQEFYYNQSFLLIDPDLPN